MVLPLIPIGIAGLGIAGGYGLSSFLGASTKKETATSGAITHAPYETYSPVDARRSAYTYNPTYTAIIESPGASFSKKDVLTTDASGATSPSFAQPQTYQTGTGGGAGGSAGTDMTKIAVIAVIGLVAYGLVSGRKK